MLALLAAAWLAERMWHGFYLTQFGDEIEHLVGAQVIAAGGRLYRDFIDVHGPVPFALAQAYGAIAGWAHPRHVRVTETLLAALMSISVAASPALRGGWERLIAVATFMALLATVWVVQGLCLDDYQMMGGACLVVATALDAAPAWAGVTGGWFSRGIAGASYVLACFVAYSFGPASVLLLASRLVARPGAWRELRALAIGGGVALAFMAAWLIRYADLLGYLTYHFVLGQVFFAPYLHFTWWNALAVLAPHGDPPRIVQAAGAVLAIGGMVLMFVPLVRNGGWRPAGAAALALAGLIWSNPRGSPNFQDATFLLIGFAVLALAFGRLSRRVKLRPAVLAVSLLAVLGSELAARHAVSSPHMYTRAELRHLAPEPVGFSDEAWAQALRRAVKPEERILSIPYQPIIYIRAGRLPMRGYYDYLPWEADYGRHPWFGLKHDLCADLRRDPPPVIYNNHWVVWGLYDPEKYMPCVMNKLRADYVPAPGAPGFYVRRDRLADWTGKSASAPAQHSISASRLPAR